MKSLSLMKICIVLSYVNVIYGLPVKTNFITKSINHHRLYSVYDKLAQNDPPVAELPVEKPKRIYTPVTSANNPSVSYISYLLLVI
jgi:hypothetical protein